MARYDRVKTYATSAFAGHAHRLLEEIADARRGLTDPERKQAYDRRVLGGAAPIAQPPQAGRGDSPLGMPTSWPTMAPGDVDFESLIATSSSPRRRSEKVSRWVVQWRKLDKASFAMGVLAMVLIQLFVLVVAVSASRMTARPKITPQTTAALSKSPELAASSNTGSEGGQVEGRAHAAAAVPEKALPPDAATSLGDVVRPATPREPEAVPPAAAVPEMAMPVSAAPESANASDAAAPSLDDVFGPPAPAASKPPSSQAGPLPIKPPEAGRPTDTLAALEPLITNSIGMKMVLIPAGEFMMGSENGYSDQKPVHRVRITKAFYLGATEVTQGQYEQVMGTNPSRFRGDPQRPVELVSWPDAMEFCRKLSQKENQEYRLPTEAEWEYACRAGSSTKWCFGDDESLLVDYAWYKKNDNGSTHAVGQKRPNAWGLYDMHGNVWEWCADWYDKDYYAKSAPHDPVCSQPPGFPAGRVVRGGSCGAAMHSGPSAERKRNWSPHGRNDIYGFRLARTPTWFELLGLPPGERDLERICQAALARYDRVRCYTTSDFGEHAQEHRAILCRLARAVRRGGLEDATVAGLLRRRQTRGPEADRRLPGYSGHARSEAA